MKKHLVVAAAIFAATALSASAQFIATQWTFEGDVITPSTGTGTASLVGGTTATFATGNIGGRAWNTTAYAAQSSGSGTRGVQFLSSTLGLSNVVISYDHRASGTASRWAQFEYTINGGSSWVIFGDNAGGAPQDTFYPSSFNLNAISAVNNNADFGFRVVSIFSPLAFDENGTSADFSPNSAYMRANSDAVYTPGGGIGSGTYAGTGTWRFDNVTLTAVPEPQVYALAFAGLLVALIGIRRARARQLGA